MNENRHYAFPPDFDPATQALVGNLFWQLELKRQELAERVQNLEVATLEWQPRPGVNSVGWLLQHIAFAEIYWVGVYCEQRPYMPEGSQLVHRILDLPPHEDGLPMNPDSPHPEVLRGLTVTQYLGMIERTRALTKALLLGWSDASLPDEIPGKRGTITRAWIIYHLIEHFSHHAGQIFDRLYHRKLIFGVE